MKVDLKKPTEADLKKPTEADLEKIQVAMAAFIVTLRQFTPVMVKAVSEAGAQARAMSQAFRRVLEANLEREGRRRG